MKQLVIKIERSTMIWAASCRYFGRTMLYLVAATFSLPIHAVTGSSGVDKPTHWVRDSAELNWSLRVPVIDKIKTVKIPNKKLILRAKKSKSDERIDPVAIRVPSEAQALADLVVEIAKPRYRTAVHRKFMDQLTEGENLNKNSSKVTIPFEMMKMLRIDQLAEMLAHQHHDLTIMPETLRQSRTRRQRLMSQLVAFLPEAERNLIRHQIRTNQPISVDTLMLPSFAKKMVEKFTIFRGPNCFHAALAFHGRNISNSPWFNVKEEEGYHRSMINYDELWRALNTAFYEVDTRRDQVEYGDILVFFDIPFEYRGGAIDFKWIRHTAAYLFDKYTFSKGSKSPDTPYTIKTLDEEWTTWRRYTKNLGVKVYRRALNNVKKRPPRDLTDWLY